MTTPPTEPTYCLALVKPGSRLAREWKLLKPSYGIYEYDRAFGTRELRWGDGSWQELTDEDHADLILLPQFGKKDIEALFDY